MFLKPLDSQSGGKTWEMIIKKRVQNMVRFENKNITFVYKIHFEKNQKNEEFDNWKIKKSNKVQKSVFPKIALNRILALPDDSRGKCVVVALKIVDLQNNRFCKQFKH